MPAVVMYVTYALFIFFVTMPRLWRRNRRMRSLVPIFGCKATNEQTNNVVCPGRHLCIFHHRVKGAMLGKGIENQTCFTKRWDSAGTETLQCVVKRICPQLCTIPLLLLQHHFVSLTAQEKFGGGQHPSESANGGDTGSLS